jgi:hypothetical protein
VTRNEHAVTFAWTSNKKLRNGYTINWLIEDPHSNLGCHIQDELSMIHLNCQTSVTKADSSSLLSYIIAETTCMACSASGRGSL